MFAESDLKEQLKQTIKNKLISIWARLGIGIEGAIDDFANMLYEKGIIGRGTRNLKDYNKMMDEFIGTMDTFETVDKYEKHCEDLLSVLMELGGSSRGWSEYLRKLWKDAMKDNLNIEFLVH